MPSPRGLEPRRGTGSGEYRVGGVNDSSPPAAQGRQCRRRSVMKPLPPTRRCRRCPPPASPPAPVGDRCVIRPETPACVSPRTHKCPRCSPGCRRRPVAAPGCARSPGRRYRLGSGQNAQLFLHHRDAQRSVGRDVACQGHGEGLDSSFGTTLLIMPSRSARSADIGLAVKAISCAILSEDAFRNVTSPRRCRARPARPASRRSDVRRGDDRSQANTARTRRPRRCLRPWQSPAREFSMSRMR